MTLESSIVSEYGVFASWGFIQWAITGSITSLVVTGGLIWRLGTKVGEYQSEFKALHTESDARHEENARKAEHFESELQKLRESDRVLERTIAGLPDTIMFRLELMLRETHRRIDEVLTLIVKRQDPKDL